MGSIIQMHIKSKVPGLGMRLQNKDIYAEADPFFLLRDHYGRRQVSLLLWYCIGLLTDFPLHSFPLGRQSDPGDMFGIYRSSFLTFMGFHPHSERWPSLYYFLPLYHSSSDPWLLSKPPSPSCFQVFPVLVLQHTGGFRPLHRWFSLPRVQLLQ